MTVMVFVYVDNGYLVHISSFNTVWSAICS